MTSGQAKTLAFGFLVCSLENIYFQYDEIISTSTLPFHYPLVMNITTFLAYFSLDFYKIQLVDYYANILYLPNTHKLHGS